MTRVAWLSTNVAVALSLVMPGRALTQQAGPRLMENVRAKPREEHGSAIKVDVNLVLVPVTVRDEMGRIVSGLQRSNFIAYDDGQLQPISSFSSVDAPFSVGLVFDTSGSMRGKMSPAPRFPWTLICDMENQYVQHETSGFRARARSPEGD